MLERLNQPIDIYCERLGPALWAEPLNFVSNLSFIIAGIYGLMLAKKDAHGFGNTRLYRFLSYLAVTIGIGSALFHSFATMWAQLADVIPIGVFLLIFLYASLRHGFGWTLPRTGAGLAAFFALSGIVAAAAQPLPVNGSEPYFGTAMTLCVLGLYGRRRGMQFAQFFLQAAAVFALSLICRSIDMRLCTAWPFGTHFLWHTINGIVIARCLGAAHRFSF